MLVLSRRVGEEIVINDNIRVTVVAVECDRVRLGVIAPRDVTADNNMDDRTQPDDDDEAGRLRQLVQSRFGSRVRDFRVFVRRGVFVLQGRTCSYHLKQLIQETVVGATTLRLATNEIAVDKRNNAETEM